MGKDQARQEARVRHDTIMLPAQGQRAPRSFSRPTWPSLGCVQFEPAESDSKMKSPFKSH